MRSKGFTLIELLVVVAIVAILAVVVVLTINPTELLRQGRDTSRISDMGTLNKAVSLYYQDAMNNPSTLFMGTSSVIYVSIPDTTTATSTAGDQCQGLGLPSLPTNFTYHCAASSTYMMTNGTGWIPINFNSYVSSVTGSMISNLPVDPTNTTSTRLYYTYETDGIGGYEVTGALEAAKDKLGGSNDIISGDGGALATVYEKGSKFGLEPMDYGDSSLVGLWTMDEGTGSTSGVTQAYDYSGNGNNGTWYGTAAGTNSTYYSAGKVGPWAGTFDGGTNYVAKTSFVNLPTNIFTISNWVNIGNYTGTYIMSTGLDNATAHFALFTHGLGTGAGSGASGLFHFEMGSGANIINSLSAPVVGTWYLLTVTANGSTITFYVNGVSQGISSQGTAAIGTHTFTAGSYNASARYVLNGLIDDVRIYNRALSAAEIKALYNGGK